MRETGGRDNKRIGERRIKKRLRVGGGRLESWRGRNERMSNATQRDRKRGERKAGRRRRGREKREGRLGWK